MQETTQGIPVSNQRRVSTTWLSLPSLRRALLSKTRKAGDPQTLTDLTPLPLKAQTHRIVGFLCLLCFPSGGVKYLLKYISCVLDSTHKALDRGPCPVPVSLPKGLKPTELSLHCSR